ncbi:diguanylate cyclase [Devosia rhodophyticola]|uniref:Diguanylate cyclase n=1 Tax=Devosia rhodophyticola TaxID=3026423 RepID=A0ABY7YYR6_9HYPH|nr:diguanylate cyclase [Devosia rhodophyticola]WDR06533.1 diguanylate cyclase [Devosia rhodophyticola]
MAFVVAAVYIGSLLLQRQSALEPMGRGNVTWLIAQSPSEYARLEQRIGAYGLGDAGIDVNEVTLRFDIVSNRMQTLHSNSLAPFIASDPRHARTLKQLDGAVDSARLLLSEIHVKGTPARMLALLDPVYPKLVRLSVDANSWNAERLNREREELFGLQKVFAWVATGLIICGFVFVVLLLLNNRLLKRTHEQLRRKDRALQIQYNWFEAAVNNMSQGLCLTDSNQRLLVSNRQFLNQFALQSGANWQGEPLAKLLPSRMLPTLQSDDPGEANPDQLIEPFQRQTHRLDDGTVLFVTHEPMVNGGWVSTFEDITDRQRAQDRIAHMAHHDGLTGLPNRLLFWQHTEQAIVDLTDDGEPFAILYLDIDRFKEVNDTLGHPTGDALLRAIADRLGTAAAAPDIIARLSGDEFAVLHRPTSQLSSSTQALAEWVLEAISQPYLIDHKELQITTSIGIAFAPQDGADSDELIKKADLALYRAKELGANNFRCFAPEMEEKIQRRRSLEVDLKRGIAAGQFQLYYQPLISLQTMKIVSGEALLRWNHPVHGSRFAG